MKLAEIAEIITENVEKLVPHLEKQVEEYVIARKEAGLPPYGGRSNTQFTGHWSKKAVEWVIRADPRFLKDKSKNKPLKNSKAPFAKHILRWWLDPTAGGGIELPEDIETTAEYLKRFNVAKQQGLNISPDQISSWDEMLTILEPYATEEDVAFDRYTAMGFDTVLDSGPWKMYKIDKWVDGPKSTLYPDQVEHKAFEGTGVCVKYKRTFETSYSPPYYLVLYNGKRMALINFPSLQFKNMDDKPLRSRNPELAQEFIDTLVTADPTWLAEISLHALRRFRGAVSRNYGDFTGLLDKYQDELVRILDTPETIERVKNDYNLFNSWSSYMCQNGSPERVVQLGLEVYDPRKPDIELKIFNKWLDCISRYAKNLKEVDEIVNNGLTIANKQPESRGSSSNANAFNAFIQRIVAIAPYRKDEIFSVGQQYYTQLLANDSSKINQALSFGRDMTQIGIKTTFLDNIILDLQSPRYAFVWAKISKPRGWPEAEQIIVQDDKVAKKYEIIFGRKPKGQQVTEPKTPQEALRICIVRQRDIPEFEDLILQDLDSAITYAVELVGPWSELEDLLRERGTPEQIETYTQRVMYGEEF